MQTDYPKRRGWNRLSVKTRLVSRVAMIRNNRLDRNKARLVWITEDEGFISIVLFHP